MPQHISAKHTAGPLIVMALLLFLFIGVKHFQPLAARPIAEDTAITMPYRTISIPGDPDSLYAYELHRRTIPQDATTEYCAIIKQIDPCRDDYKAYCRLVVEDVVKSTGNKKIIVYIYDSNEACHLYEAKYLQQMEMLSNTELKLVGEHRVATYIGERLTGYETGHLLSYYEDAHNGLAATEIYEP